MEISTIMLDSDVFLTIKGVSEYKQINVNDIISITASDKYVIVNTVSGTRFKFISSIKEISKFLTNFIQVDKGFIVNRYYIVSLTKNPKNVDKYILTMTNGINNIDVEISSYLAKKVLEQL